MRTTDGWLVPDEYVDVILEYLKNNGALNPNITSVMDAHDYTQKNTQKVYLIEYTSSNTNQGCHLQGL